MPGSAGPWTSPIFVLEAKGVTAAALEFEGQMVVLADSEACEDELSSLAYNVKVIREQLRQAGKLVPSERQHVLKFVEDIAFNSPSAAAQAVAGTSRNGRNDWKIRGTNKTYAEWQEAEVKKAEAESQSAE